MERDLGGGRKKGGIGRKEGWRGVWGYGLFLADGISGGMVVVFWGFEGKFSFFRFFLGFFENLHGTPKGGMKRGFGGVFGGFLGDFGGVLGDF